MPVYVVTGKLGSGKTLASVGRIRDYIKEGRPVATNLDLFPENYPNPRRRKAWRITRLPDKPQACDMHALGRGNETVDESRNGAIVLDECGTWLNSRGWNDKGRRELIDWFLHARKLGWDIYFIVQSLDVLDSQAKATLCEHAVFCRRLDRMSIAFIGPLLRVMGFTRVMPKIHFAIVKYGDSVNSPTVDRWWYRGHDLYALYDTRQVFRAETRDYVGAGSPGLYSVLSPWHLKGRYMEHPPKLRELLMRGANLALQAVVYVAVSIAAVACGRSLHATAVKLGVAKADPAPGIWREGPLHQGER